jgi:UDP-glucuronate 4-epimerase
MLRDFTYIDDIVNGVISVDSDKNLKNFSIYNIGNSNPYNLMDFIKTLENVIGKKAKINFKTVRKGDVLKTYSDISKIKNDFNYSPSTTLNKGLKSFYDWYNKYIYNKNII